MTKQPASELSDQIKRDPANFNKPSRVINAECQERIRHELLRQEREEVARRCREIAEANAHLEHQKRAAAEFARLAKEAQLRAAARQQGKGRDQMQMEPVGNTPFFVTARGEFFVLDYNRRLVRTTPTFE